MTVRERLEKQYAGFDDFKAKAEKYDTEIASLNEKITAMPECAPLGEKYRLIIPEESVVGVIINAPEGRMVVRSSAKGLQQHNPMTWQVAGTTFEQADGQTGNSTFVESIMGRWLRDMTEDERRGLTEMLFDGMEATGANTMGEAKAQGLNAAGAMVWNMLTMNADRQKDVLGAVGKLVRAGGGQLIDGAIRGVDGLMGIIGLGASDANDKKPGGKADGPKG